jgi:hypothetical protein
MNSPQESAVTPGPPVKSQRGSTILMRLMFVPFGLLFTGLSLFLAWGFGWVLIKAPSVGPSPDLNEVGWLLTYFAVIAIFGFVGVRMLIGILERGDAWMPLTTQVLLGLIFLGCGVGSLERSLQTPRTAGEPEFAAGGKSLFLFFCVLVMAFSVTAC